MVRRVAVTLVCVLWLGPAWGAEFRASVDRTQLKLHEPVSLTLSLINSDTRLRAQGVDPNVDLTLLGEDFDLGRPEASTYYNIYRGQGRSTSEITVELFPTRTGTLTIPAFRVDGLSTKPIKLRVLALEATVPEEVFVRSGANVDAPWVGQQLVVWLDLYHRVELESASLGSNFETAPVQIELLPNWKLPQESRTEHVDGLEYEVERSAWAVFPNQAGPFTVELPDIWVTTQRGDKLRLPHQTLEFQVKALPEGLPGDIIVGQAELTAESLPEAFTQYQLSEWTLTLKAPVGVTVLPRLLPGIELPAGLKLFPDPARYHTEQDSGGIMDAADYTLSIMPLAAGAFELPPIRVPYFDPESGRAKLAEVPGRTIRVAANPLPQPKAVIDNPPPAAAKEISATSQPNWQWQLATAVMTLLWLTTLLKLWRRPNTQPATKESIATTTTNPKETRHPLQQKLLQALDSRTLEQGLQQWRAQYPEDETVAVAVRALQRNCYGGEDASEATLRRKVDTALAQIRRRPIKPAANAADPWQPESFSPHISDNN